MSDLQGKTRLNRSPATTLAARPQAVSSAPSAEAPQVAAGDARAALAALLKLEEDVRRAATERELTYLMANETRKLTRAQQVFVMSIPATGASIVETVSSYATVDRSAPLIQWVERMVRRLRTDADATAVQEFTTSAYSDPGEDMLRAYPLMELLWVPLKDRPGKLMAGLLLAREIPWLDADIAVAKRLAEAYAFAMAAARTQRRPFAAALRPNKYWLLGSTAVAAALAFWPVALTTLAPLEIGAKDAFIVTASIDGAIDDIAVWPNAVVSEGQLLGRLADTMLRNRLEVAEREVLVTEAKLKKASQLAFVDVRGRHELAIATSELELKTAERDTAIAMLARTELKSPRAGLAVFSDKKELIGRPVAVGERVMEIADPAKFEARIFVPVADAIILRNGARAKLFLDSDPLRPLEARVVRSDYQARVHDGDILAFRVTAETDGTPPHRPRLGVRGTAQLFGETVSLGFYLLRRPIAALRQWTGL
jgi:HlyD family secretion protein